MSKYFVKIKSGGEHEMLDLDGDLWDEKPIGVEEVKIHFER